MTGIFASAIAASLLASTASAAYAETKITFRYATGAVSAATVDEEPEAPDDIPFNFAPSAYCAGNSVSMTGLVRDGHSVSLESGMLPTDLALNGTSISGTATVAGLYDGLSFRVTTPKGSSKVFGPYAMHISDLPNPTMTPQQILTRQNYSHSIPVSGGTGPFEFETVSSIPWLTVHADGTVTGTPMAAGDYRLDVAIMDSALFPQTRNRHFKSV